MEMNSDTSFLYEAENDDDIFYAEIKRQILLLTTEDNEDLLEAKRFNNSVAYGGANRSVTGFYSAAASPAGHFCSWETENSGSPPLWLVNLWKSGKGTGVFIPQVVSCKKSHRPGRMNSSRRQIYRPVENKD